MDDSNIPGAFAVHYDVPLAEARKVFEGRGFVGITNLAYASDPMDCNQARTAAMQGAMAGNAHGYHWIGDYESNVLARCRVYRFDYTGYDGPTLKGAPKEWIGSVPAEPPQGAKA